MISLFSVFGLEENAPMKDVENECTRLLKCILPEKYPEASLERAEAQRCLVAIENAYRTLTTPELRRLYTEQLSEYLKSERKDDTHPRLGQLCVASGMISMDQLKEAVEAQRKNKMPLGEVLLALHFISAAQLEGLLLGQEMIDVPSAVKDKQAIRFISLGLISEDMALIAQMESRTLGDPIAEIVFRHGWVSRQILDLLEQPISSLAAPDSPP